MYYLKSLSLSTDHDVIKGCAKEIWGIGARFLPCFATALPSLGHVVLLVEQAVAKKFQWFQLIFVYIWNRQTSLLSPVEKDRRYQVSCLLKAPSPTGRGLSQRYQFKSAAQLFSVTIPPKIECAVTEKLFCCNSIVSVIISAFFRQSIRSCQALPARASQLKEFQKPHVREMFQAQRIKHKIKGRQSRHCTACLHL